MKTIVGLTGSFGAGKGAVAEYLVDKKGFAHFSARDFITREIKRRCLPVNRESMIEVANDLRTAHTPSYIIEQLFNDAQMQDKDAVIESLRAVAEAQKLKELGGVVIGVDADTDIRYQRMIARGTETDDVSLEKWKQQQKEETNPSDPTKQDIYGTLKESDYIIVNNGTLEELHSKVDEVLDTLMV